MEFEVFKHKCINIFALNQQLPSPSDSQINALFKLTEIMLTVNKSMNLTAITDEDSIILRHYADSVSICSLIPQGADLIDVGCGAGFPCLPVAIFRPDVTITAIDSTAKRIEYVKSTAAKLGLSNVTAIAGRAEEYAKDVNFRESFDVATARAVAALPILSELCLPFVKVGGHFIAMKGSQGKSELLNSKNAIKLCGGNIGVATSSELTANGTDREARTLIKINKTFATPSKYPRHYSQISKKPL